MFNSLRLALATTAVALSFGGTALAATAPSGPVDVETPDCYTTCTKTLGPGQRLVVGTPSYAFSSVGVNGTATGFGARFVLKRAPDAVNYSKVVEVPLTTAFAPSYSLASSPWLFPGVFKAIAVNDSTWLTTTVRLSLTTR